MQWTCRRCGLQRDDRRGSNCSDVKGQAHDWVDTNEYYNDKCMERVKEWIASKDSFEWKSEYESIKVFLKKETIRYQQKYIESCKSLEFIDTNYKKLLEDGIEKHNKWIEFDNDFLKKKKRFMIHNFIFFIIIAIICFFVVNSISSNIFISVVSLIILIIINRIYRNKKIENIRKKIFNRVEWQEIYKFLNDVKTLSEEASKKITLGMRMEEESLTQFISRLGMQEVLNVYKYCIESKMKNEREAFIKKIKHEYKEDIIYILKKGISLINENNKKYNVDADYTYDDIRFYVHSVYDEDNDDREYGKIWGWHLDDISFKDKFINDDEFTKKFNIINVISDWDI